MNVAGSDYRALLQCSVLGHRLVHGAAKQNRISRSRLSRDLFETPRVKKARKLFYENAEEAGKKIPGMLSTLEEAALDWLAAEESFSTLLGFIIGLRMAGISSERTKAMARTWRLGGPQDDKELSRRRSVQ